MLAVKGPQKLLDALKSTILKAKKYCSCEGLFDILKQRTNKKPNFQQCR